MPRGADTSEEETLLLQGEPIMRLTAAKRILVDLGLSTKVKQLDCSTIHRQKRYPMICPNAAPLPVITLPV